eukprot:m.78195 g.78195  ORF g.78195 m.78195 type:complete len:67 (+) comp36089_c0_seq3:1208-1408(+)
MKRFLHLLYYFTLVVASSSGISIGRLCPSECQCSGTTVRCNGAYLSRIPTAIPADTTILYTSWRYK